MHFHSVHFLWVRMGHFAFAHHGFRGLRGRGGCRAGSGGSHAPSLGENDRAKTENSSGGNAGCEGVFANHVFAFLGLSATVSFPNCFAV